MNTTMTTRDAPTIAPRYFAFGLIGVMLIAACVAIWGSVTLYRKMQVTQLSRLCDAARKEESWERLESLARQWIAVDRSHALPWIYAAEAAQQQGNYNRAAELLANLPDDDPKTIPALVERSTLLFGPLNRVLEGVDTCQRVLELNPRVREPRQRLIFFYAQTL